MKIIVIREGPIQALKISRKAIKASSKAILA